MKEDGVNVVKWDALSHFERVRIVIRTNLPTCLAASRWSQLTASEQDELFKIDWWAVLNATT